MKDDNSSREGIDADLEARLVALILGEASEFEVESLERLMARRPEVREMKERLEVVHGLVGEAVESEHPDAKAWKLSPSRRAHVMETLGIGNGGPTEEPNGNGNGNGESKEARIRRASRKVLWAAAACLMLNVVLFGWLVGKLGGAFEGSYSLTGASPESIPLVHAGSEAEAMPSARDLKTAKRESAEPRSRALQLAAPERREESAFGGRQDRAQSALAKLRSNLGGDTRVSGRGGDAGYAFSVQDLDVAGADDSGAAGGTDAQCRTWMWPGRTRRARSGSAPAIVRGVGGRNRTCSRHWLPSWSRTSPCGRKHPRRMRRLRPVMTRRKTRTGWAGASRSGRGSILRPWLEVAEL